MKKIKDVPILKSSRVTLRPIDLTSDSLSWYELMKDPQMHLWTGNTIPSTIIEARDLLQKYKENEDIITWSIVRNENNEMIGTYWIAVPLKLEDKIIITAEAQRVGQKFWRKGYTSEARKLIYDYAFYELMVDEIHAQAWANNINSCRSMESMGFKLMSTREKVFAKHNKTYIENYYVLFREVWEKIHKTLDKKS